MKYKIIDNVLTKEQCEELINRQHKWKVTDVISDKGVLNTEGHKIRQVKESFIENIFDTWDGLKVLGTKVMRYEEGDFVKGHRDRLGMLHSSCYEEGSDLYAKDLMVIPLNDDYLGGHFHVEKDVVPQKIGSLIQLAQSGKDEERTPHGVLPVKEGTRYSLVFWNFA